MALSHFWTIFLFCMQKVLKVEMAVDNNKNSIKELTFELKPLKVIRKAVFDRLSCFNNLLVHDGDYNLFTLDIRLV